MKVRGGSGRRHDDSSATAQARDGIDVLAIPSLPLVVIARIAIIRFPPPVIRAIVPIIPWSDDRIVAIL
jgi:hypothetical protein